MKNIQLNQQWLAHLSSEFEQDYMQQLGQYLRSEKAAGKQIYPAGKSIFAALDSTPLDQVKVVVLGQDPYHGPGQAHGLSFSVPNDVVIPPSLRNIYKEINSDLGLPLPPHGYLMYWAQQGVLLLNSVLTVVEAHAASHQGQGWERFTDKVIEVVNRESENVVFMLWGAYAQKKGQSINRSRHLVLTAPHPSPLSAHRGFFGCRHFSQANSYLESKGLTGIDWSIN